MFVNIAVPTVYQGNLYDGVCIHPGVNISMEAINCMVESTILNFDNGDKQPRIRVEAVSSIEESDRPAHRFLQIREA